MEVLRKLVLIFAMVSIADAEMKTLEVFSVIPLGEADFTEYLGIEIPHEDRDRLCVSAAGVIQKNRAAVVGPGVSLEQKAFTVLRKHKNPQTNVRVQNEYNMVRCKDGSNNPSLDFYVLQFGVTADHFAVHYDPFDESE